MKRKLPGNIKGTPVITKYFKRSFEVKSKTPKDIVACPKEIEIKVVLENTLTNECRKNIGRVVKEKRKQQNTRTSSKYLKKTNLFPHENCCIKQNVIDTVVTTDGNGLLTSNNIIQKKRSITEGLTSTDIENVELVNLSPNKINSQKNVSADHKKVLADHKETLQQVNVSANKNCFLEKELSPLFPKVTLRKDQHQLEFGNNNKNLQQVNSSTEKNNFQEKDLSPLLLKQSFKELNKPTSNCVENLEPVTFSTSNMNSFYEEDLPLPLSNEAGGEEDMLTSNCEESPNSFNLHTNKNLYSSLNSTGKNNILANVTEMEISDSHVAAAAGKCDNYSDIFREEDKPKTLNAEAETGDIEKEDCSNMDEEDEDESDDELLCPPAFLLQDYRLQSEVKTPEKCGTPLACSPLTPVSPFVARKNDAVQCRYSLAKLVLQKPKQVKKDKEMERLQSAIHEQIEKGRMARFAEDTGKSEDDDETILPIHQKELDKFSSKDEVFGEEIPGENIFPEFKELVRGNNGCSQPFPTLDTNGLDAFTKSLFARCDVEIRELLCGSWITQRYLVRPCPRAVVQWLFHVLSYHLDTHTIQASYNALWSILNAQTDEEKSDFSWMPSIQDVLCVFYNYGANFTSLFPDVWQEMNIFNTFVTSDQEVSSNTEQETQGHSLFPLVNLTRVIQFLTLCVAKSPGRYTTKDIEVLVVALCCLSLDLRMDMCQQDIKTCLEAAYNDVDFSNWPDEAIKLSLVIYQIQTHHRHRLHLAQIQPYSCRGRDIRRLSSIQILASLVENPMTGDEVQEVITKDSDIKEDKEVTDTIKLFETLEKLLHQVHISDDTDYHQLYTIIELLDVVVGAETLLPREKVVLERITGRLSLLHRDIKDPRAMFISRTKVKDLILRTISKFVFMAQGKREVQKSINTFFEDSKCDLYIETLKEPEVLDENVDLETEKSFDSFSEQCSLSPASEVSDPTDNTTAF